MDSAAFQRELDVLRSLGVSDEELVAQALAADPDIELPADARPLGELGGSAADGQSGGPLLPDWYMTAPAAGPSPHRRWRRRVAVGLVSTFVLINAAGLCSTYGSVVIA